MRDPFDVKQLLRDLFDVEPFLQDFCDVELFLRDLFEIEPFFELPWMLKQYGQLPLIVNCLTYCMIILAMNHFIVKVSFILKNLLAICHFNSKHLFTGSFSAEEK